MWLTRMDWLSPLFIIVFGSMGGKSECSMNPAYHGRLSAVACSGGFAIPGELIFSHKSTKNPGAYYRNLCCLSFVKSGFHWDSNILKGKWHSKKVLKNNIAKRHGKYFGIWM